MNIPLHIHPQIASVIQLLSTDDKENSTKAIQIIESVIDNYDMTQYPSYSTGLAGIGCGIQYIIQTFMPETNADGTLAELDEALFLSVYFRDHIDLTHANGLTGIASYFFYRLQDKNASANNVCTLTCQSALLSILDIISAKYGLNGYSYPPFNENPKVDRQEEDDIKVFLSEFIKYDICSAQANRVLTRLINKEPSLLIQPTSINKELKDVTIIIPIRIDSTERRDNLHTVLQLYTSETNINFFVLEAGKQQLLDLTKYKEVEYLFIKDENPFFHHTHYRNEMIKRVKTPIVAVWDADIIVPIEQLYEAAEVIRNQNIVISYPFDGICYNLPDDLSRHFRNKRDIQMIQITKQSLPTMFGQLTVGGVFLANRKEYSKAGMENEYFIGWGPEDIERLKRITGLDLPVYRIKGEIYHLWHPRKANSGFADHEHNIRSKKELMRICEMSKENLQKEVNKWEWIN